MPAKNKHEDKSERIDFRVCFNRRRNVCFLFYIESVGHGKHAGTISVATSFISVYFTFRRSPLHSLFYASNDIVLIILWSFACAKDPSQMAVIVCFCVFLVNDVYGYISWIKTAKRQGNSSAADEQR